MNTSCCSTSRSRGSQPYRRPFGVSLRWHLAATANRIRRRFYPHAAGTTTQRPATRLS